MAKQRPVNLNLFTIKFPIPAIISILHRASGAVLFLLIPFVLWIFQASLSSISHFSEVQAFFANPIVKLIAWLSLAALLFHLIAGIRHLIMDLGIGESLRAARFSSWLVIAATAFLILLVGFWLWQIT